MGICREPKHEKTRPMDHTENPMSQGPRGPEPSSLDARLRALEQHLAEQQDQLRDYEKSLVERIADVDDDRRTTASKLQRAWQTQREEIDDVLRRQTRTTLGLLLVFALLFAGTLFFAFREVQSGLQPLLEDVTQAKQELARLSSFAVQDDPLQEELSRLSAAVREISSSLGQTDKEQVTGLQATLDEAETNRRTEDARLDSEIRRLQAEQKRLLEQIASLRESREAIEAQAAPPAPEIAEPLPGPRPVPAQEPAPTVAGTPAEQAPLAAERPDTAAGQPDTEIAEAPAEAGVDASEDEGPGGTVDESIEVGDQRFALQLIGFFSRDALLKFVRREGLPARVYYREDTYRGRPWFALIHSLYDDYAAAESEVSRLPANLIALDPWIRPLRQGEDLKVLETGTGR